MAPAIGKQSLNGGGYGSSHRHKPIISDKYTIVKSYLSLSDSFSLASALMSVYPLVHREDSMAQAQATQTAVEAKKARQRSPNYPAIGLRDAIEKVRLLHDADKRAGAPLDAALKHMGFSTRHGQAMTIVSALKKYGLVEETANRIVPTQRAMDILVFQDQDARKIRALREAALGPDIYRELFEQYKTTGIPSEETLRAELIADRHFNPNSVQGFIQDFKDTLILAGLLNPVELSLQLEDDSTEMSDSVQTSAQTAVLAPRSMSQGMKEISLPVGVTADGQAVFAHVRFDAPLKKEMLSSLRALLDAVEKTLN